MDSLISQLREKRATRDAERSRLEAVQVLENESRNRELKELKDDRLKCMETLVNNLNSTTAHRHTISKVVHQSDKLIGLPISNVYHRQAQEFVAEAVKLLSDQKSLFKSLNLENSVDPEDLSRRVQCCTQSSMDTYKGMNSSVERVQTLMDNVHIISPKDDEQGLETSIFDE